MQIDWWTLALQAINFIVLAWLLWRFLYRPVKDVIEKRKQLAEQAFAVTEERKMEAEAARQRFEEGRAGLAQERQEILKKTHAEVEVERTQILEQARTEAQKILDEARKAIAKERETTLEEVREEVAELASEIASSILRKAGGGSADTVLLEQLEQQLRDMPIGEHDRLGEGLEPEAARLTVVTAAPLQPDEQARWIDRLSARFGCQDKIDFSADPEILGGVELRFPHAILRATWADQLRKAEAQLKEDAAAS